MTYYLGDPCYIIPDEDWMEFCNLMFGKENPSIYDHLDCVINWHGQKIEIWSNGGDGTWEFTGLNTLNETQEFGVDAGIFCIIDLEKLPQHQEVGNSGMLFDKKPDLYVENTVVYINDIPDNSVKRCFECDHAEQHLETYYCDNGCCEGCEYCFEDCKNEVGDV